ncbi:Las1-like-domain-containing protein [Phlebopus sp. FC_14]|nr:Las1-like-domain-containing protein [Phlebopus sp. FC_14]
MRLPRRVPWAHVGELEQVCSWIFMDEADLEAKTFAINRLSAWKAATALPHALESTLAILVARSLDATSQTATQGALVLRQTYAAAIIRMVNGLVDPLQVGVYARSIASIAAQLGLPSWLVELRHAATHEDLPSLELLREAAHESLSWLLNNYFLPTINPATSVPTPAPLRPVAPLLHSYKLLMKIVTRDASMRKQHQPEIDAVVRNIERWIAEAKVSADLTIATIGWASDDNGSNDQSDLKEKWALENLCDALLDKGAIVPLSKKKRRTQAESLLPTNACLAVWVPLLQQLQSHHPNFSSVFTTRIMNSLLEDRVEPTFEASVIDIESAGSERDPTYDEYLVRWVVWATRTWKDSADNENDLCKDVILQIAPVLAPGSSGSVQKMKPLAALLQAVASGSKDLENAIELLVANTIVRPAQRWQTDDLSEMDERLRILISLDVTMTHADSGSASKNTETPEQVSQEIGWTLLGARSNWKPCPIGVYYAGSC